METAKVALITGAARRIGAALTRRLHQSGYRVLIHYHDSAAAARTLCAELEAKRPDSAKLLCADLADAGEITGLAGQALAGWGYIDALINNASCFYPTPFGKITWQDWEQLINTNLRGPFFLCQALAPSLRQRQGSIINLVDVYAERPLAEHSVYSISKSGLAMLTRSLAWELGPEIRVNGIAPGAILWPEQDTGASLSAQAKSALLEKTALKRLGSPEDICSAALFLLEQAPQITGQIINVDGGRTLNQ